MVARNFSLQDISYTRLTTVSEDEDDDHREFLTLQELKPHHLTEISQFIDPPSESNENLSEKIYTNLQDQRYITTYYDLNQQHHSK